MEMLRKYLLEFSAYPLWLRILLPSAGVIFMAALIAQMILFPDNPIYPKNGGYVGKYGAVHTREEYEVFIAINRVILVAALASFGGFFCSVVFGAGYANEQDGKHSTEKGSRLDKP